MYSLGIMPSLLCSIFARRAHHHSLLCLPDLTRVVRAPLYDERVCKLPLDLGNVGDEEDLLGSGTPRSGVR